MAKFHLDSLSSPIVPVGPTPTDPGGWAKAPGGLQARSLHCSASLRKKPCSRGKNGGRVWEFGRRGMVGGHSTYPVPFLLILEPSPRSPSWAILPPRKRDSTA